MTASGAVMENRGEGKKPPAKSGMSRQIFQKSKTNSARLMWPIAFIVEWKVFH